MPAYVGRVVMALLVLITVGCGGGSSSSSTAARPSTFRSDFAVVVGQFKQTSHAIGLAIEHAPSQTDAQISAAFSGLAARWQTDIGPLRSLTPPPALSSRYRALTMAVTRAEADLNAIVAAAQTHNGSGARQASARLVRDILQAKADSQVITRRLGLP